MVNKQGFMFLFCTVFLIFVALSAVNATNINDTPTTISSNSDMCVNNTISMNTSKDKSYFKNIIKNQTNKNINKDNLIKESKQVNSNKTITSNTQKSNTNKKSLKTTNNTLNVDTNGTETAYFFIHSNGELQENITENGNSTEFTARNYIPQISSGGSSLIWDGTVNMSQIINDWHINSASTNWVVETKGQYALNKYIIKTPDGLKTFLKVNDTTKYVSEKQSKQILKNFYPDMYSKYYNSSYRIIETNYIYFPYSIKREKYDKLIHIDGIIIPYYVFELIPVHDKDPINNITKKPSTTKATILNSTYKNSKLNITVLDANTNAVIKNGTVFVTLPNGTEVMGVTDNNGNVVIPVDLSVGEYELPVTFMGNENYTVSNTTVLIIIQKIYTNIKVEATNTKVNKTNIIKVTLTNGNGLVGEKVVLTIDDKKYNLITKENGVATFTTYSSSIERNNVLVTAEYFGNENIGYDSCINSTVFNVEKLNTKITVNQISNAIIGQNITLTGNLTDEFGHIVSNENIVLCFEKDNKNITVTTNSNGTYTFTYNVYREGSFDVIIYYYGNTALNPSSIGFHTYVVKINTNITVNQVANTTVDKNVSIKGTLKDEFGNIMANTKVVLTVNNQMVSLVTDEFGHYTYDYITNVLGTNEVYVIYEGNNSHNYSTNVTSFNVRKISSIIDVNKIYTIVIGNNVTVNGTLKDEFGNKLVNTTISLNINDKIVNVTTDNNGNYKYTFQTNKIEVNTIDVSFSGNDSYLSANTRVAFDVRKILTDVDINNISDVKINSNVVINGTLYDEYGNVMKNTPIKLIINNQTYNITTDNNGNYKYTYQVNSLNNTVEVVYLGNNTHDASYDITLFTANKLKTTVTVYPASGIIGENITLIAKITDEYGNLVNGGNLVFKLNGKTLREDGSFNSTANPLKLKVENGFVRYNLHLDMYLRNIKNVTASYSGSYIYESARAQEATVIVGKRMTQLNVTTSTTTVKQNTNITFTVKIADITPNAENRTINTGRVIFKINGKTIKDDDGNIVFSDIINNTATYTYHIPQGMASVDKNNTLRNYTVEAVYADKIYQETKNTTVFHVEKSDISIDINNVSVSKTDKTMNVTAKILDYQGNFVVGTNKICLKVNGVTLKDENNQTIYYTINNGVIDLKNIIIPVKNINNITIVTGDRQAYNSGCNTTDVIFIKE